MKEADNSNLGTDANGFTLSQILRLLKLKFVLLFTVSPSISLEIFKVL